MLPACLACVAAGQAQAPAKPVTCTPGGGKACPATDHVPSVSEQFPFPGEATPAAPDAPAPAAKPSADPANQFPYPGEKPAVPPAASGAGDRFPYPGEAPAAGSSSSSSSSDAGADPDAKPKLKDEGSEGDTAPHRRRLRPQAQKTLSDEERVQEDLTVAHFYEQSGNTLGAYLRAKDAVKLDPAASDTHLAVARLADKLAKREEAIAEYTAYLKLDPDGDASRAARKALEKLAH